MPSNAWVPDGLLHGTCRAPRHCYLLHLPRLLDTLGKARVNHLLSTLSPLTFTLTLVLSHSSADMLLCIPQAKPGPRDHNH